MFEITVKKNKNNIRASGLALIFAFILLVLIFEIPYLNVGALKQGAMLIYAIYACYYLSRFIAVTFTFTATEDRFMIKKACGRRVELPLNICIKDIVLVSDKKSPVLSEYKQKHTHTCTGWLETDFYILVYKENKEIKKVTVEKTKEVKENLLSLLGDRFYEI